jgi:hypothetical protein
MPIPLIAGAVAAVGTIGGALISSHSANSAANQANASQQAATQAELQLGQQNLGQQRDIFNAEYNLESPFVSRGNVAGQNINALLGLPAAPAMTSPLATSAPTTPAAGGNGTGGLGGSLLRNSGGFGTSRPASYEMPRPADAVGGKTETQPATSGYTGPTMAQINALRNDGIPGNYRAAMNALMAWRTAHPGQDPFGTPATTPAPGTTPTPAPAPAPGTTQPSAQDAFNTFANSAGMQFQQQQAANGLNNLYAGHSQLQSGAAMKAVPAYLQQQALNNYFMPYMGLLGQQQATGAQAGAAIGGVGSNFGSTAAGIYNGMGNAIQGGADSASNAALLRGQNNSNMWNSIGGALGTLGSSFFRPGG